VIVGPFKALAKIEKDQLIVAEGTLKKEKEAVASAGLPDPSKGGQKPPR
jgi:hypothetical protein